jgi:tetratricopeptide (TPR) repeat protein
MLALIAAGLVCGGIGFGVAFGIKAVLTPHAVAEEVHDEHAAHPPAEKEEPPNTQRLTNAVRSGNYAVGLKIARELLGEGHGNADHAEPAARGEHAEHPPPVDPRVRYTLALCLEGLDRHADAIETYQKLAADAPNGVKAVAACGEVRCHLAEGEVAEATGALVRAEGFAAGVPGLQTELDYLRGRVAFRSVPRFQPGPFAPAEPMGREPSLPPAVYADWLPLPTSSAGEAHPPPPTTSASDPTKATLAAFAAVLAADPPHPDEPAVRLVVAGLRFRAGEVDEAAREFKRVRDSRPPEVVMVAATYTLGLIRHRAGEWAVARQLFSDAADLGVHHPAMAAVAWWWAGRVELDTGNLAACKKAWERADAADDRQTNTAAALGRVFLKLLGGETERAEAALHGQRIANVDPMPAVAEVFECYFRFAHKPSDFSREQLTTAIHHAENGKPFGPAGQFLFGGWLGEAEHPNEMLQVYAAASESAPGIWGVRIALAAGEGLFTAGDKTAARSRFIAAAAADGGGYGDRARVRLAEIALADGRADECVRLCRQVLTRDHEDRPTVLRLLGRGYERLNRPRAAAECFAGRLPLP